MASSQSILSIVDLDKELQIKKSQDKLRIKILPGVQNTRDPEDGMDICLEVSDIDLVISALKKIKMDILKEQSDYSM